jgi:hypothetical protein
MNTLVQEAIYFIRERDERIKTFFPLNSLTSLNFCYFIFSAFVSIAELARNKPCRFTNIITSQIKAISSTNSTK